MHASELAEGVRCPREECGEPRCDIVSRLSLLYCQAEERPLLLPHQPQPRLRPRIVVLPAPELRHVPLAAIDPHRPEIIVTLVPLAGRNGDHTVRVRILEPQSLAEFQPGIGGKIGAPGVEHGQSGLGGGVNTRIDVEIRDAVVGRHVSLVAVRPPGRSQHSSAQNSNRRKSHPRRVLKAALPLIPPRRRPRRPEQAHRGGEPRQHHRVRRRWQLEPHGEPHADERNHEHQPGQE
mmetsp:Transcript_41250/g.89964  ORF Transcript_41250/g.89964 Transcript_41250/m.89964 type:complete len:235 (-) Transcript_41250:159-863(-)